MLKVLAKSIFSFLTVILLSVISIGCSSRHLEQNPVERYYEESAPAYSLEQSEKNATEQSQKTVTSTKPKGTSIFTVIELEDLEHPTLAASIQLPYRVGPNNTVVLAGEHAYLTTERHLHVIDVSIPQRPSYLTSLAFSDKIGKVLASGDSLVVETSKKFHLVNISEPSHPMLESTMHLPHRHGIKDLDVLDDHLYVMGENDYLYIFYIPRGHAQLVKAVELEKRWWLLSPKADGTEVKQIPLSTSNTIPSGLFDPLLSQRGFLQLSSSRDEKVRASSENLAVENLRDPMYDLFTFDVHRVNDHQTWSGKGYYNVEREYRAYLSARKEKMLTRRNPKIAYTVLAGKMQQIVQDPSTEKIDVAGKQLLGPVTDFQISGDRLYVVNAKGFFSIKRLIKLKKLRNVDELRENWFVISATPLQASHPMSLAVGEGFACVLATLED